MVASDRTVDFRQMVEKVRDALPEAKRRKVTKLPKRTVTDIERNSQAVLNKEYIRQAYNILNHITTLTRMLASIRRPYLNVDSRDITSSRQPSQRTFDIGGGDQSWAGIRYLNNEERDQVDLQAKVILSRCADRVKEMEALEKRRIELAASRTHPFMRLLPARLRQDSTTVASDFLAAHHSSITWYLNRRLAEASQTQKEMQEERIKRQMDRARTLGSGAAREAVEMSMGLGDGLYFSSPVEQSPTVVGWLGGASSTLVSALGGPSSSEPSRSALTRQPTYEDLDDDEEEDELELTSSQILQFEQENAQILKSVHDTLFSVQQAESRLLDISALQMELVAHLSRQGELTNQLYEDAIATTSMVDKGNKQLHEARRRAKDGRKWILLFLIGASASLLFLHYY